MTWSLLAVCDACTPPYEFKLGSVDAEIYSCLNALIIDGALPTRLSPFPSLPPRAPQLLQPSNQQHLYFFFFIISTSSSYSSSFFSVNSGNGLVTVTALLLTD